MATGEGQSKAAKEATKGQLIEEAILRLDTSVSDMESLAERVVGEGSASAETQAESNRGINFLLSELPADLDLLSKRLSEARVSIQDSLY